MTDEEFVRAHWEPYKWHAIDSGPLDGAMFKIYDDGHIASGGLPDVAEFTRERLEEIRQVQEEIGLAEEHLPGDMWHNCHESVIAGRIIARIKSALADLTRGMKGEQP